MMFCITFFEKRSVIFQQESLTTTYLQGQDSTENLLIISEYSRRLAVWLKMVLLGVPYYSLNKWM